MFLTLELDQLDLTGMPITNVKNDWLAEWTALGHAATPVVRSRRELCAR